MCNSRFCFSMTSRRKVSSCSFKSSESWEVGRDPDPGVWEKRRCLPHGWVRPESEEYHPLPVCMGETWEPRIKEGRADEILRRVIAHDVDETLKRKRSDPPLENGFGLWKEEETWSVWESTAEEKREVSLCLCWKTKH
mmetsp:Transcript_30419/g.78702  ORF Transcript_30419/g.78702 Transcript_30419/m.78702 type:complete len:138 (+) Transcript_30419:1732-2145(+)